jgi:sugar O-acyltransferase (sialic acid O-acetyltransferase NeuD family)
MTIIGKSEAALAMILDILEQSGYTHVQIFNNMAIPGDYHIGEVPVKECETLNDLEFALGAVMPDTKRKIVEAFPVINKTLINQKSFISKDSRMGNGCMIDSMVSISARVRIGKCVTVYSGSSIAHDSVLSDYVTICPGSSICGNVTIGEGTFIGAGSVIKNEIKIGKNCVIGCGSVVIRDVADGETVYGNPAKTKWQHKEYTK